MSVAALVARNDYMSARNSAQFWLLRSLVLLALATRLRCARSRSIELARFRAPVSLEYLRSDRRDARRRGAAAKTAQVSNSHSVTYGQPGISSLLQMRHRASLLHAASRSDAALSMPIPANVIRQRWQSRRPRRAWSSSSSRRHAAEPTTPHPQPSRATSSSSCCRSGANATVWQAVGGE